MGTWNNGIEANDTAMDLQTEYAAAFFRYDVEEALEKIDSYVRREMFDESDAAEWCNYIYSLADFMWKKGILTDSVRNKAVEMIDGEFGLDAWAEAGQKALENRKKKLGEFREKLLSPQPPKKKIKPNVQTERIFADGDIVAVRLQTAGKQYTQANRRPLSEEEFHGLDGKYVLMQLVHCYASWTSRIVPEVKDYWACFRLFDGFFDTVPENPDVSGLKDAMIHQGVQMSSSFTCESNLFYFKKRDYKVICNRKDLLADFVVREGNAIYWAINRPENNPDSHLVAAMGMQIKCHEYNGTLEDAFAICRLANRYGRFDYRLSREENEEKYAREEAIIRDGISSVLLRGGKIYAISFGRTIGIVTVEGGHIDNIYIEGQYQKNGFGTRLMEFAFSVAGQGAYIDIPESCAALKRICEKIGLEREEKGGFVCWFKEAIYRQKTHYRRYALKETKGKYNEL
ncbi:MAG: hypothetical protein E7335_09150 [Clostridiales bacterium]|nr:hypothetical protein [Clostridiales bacterium]